MAKKSLDIEFKVRLTKQMMDGLESAAVEDAGDEEPNVSKIIRQAIREHLDNRDPKKVKAARLKAANETAVEL